jgi:23S rRNA pseudouridine2605 synthase
MRLNKYIASGTDMSRRRADVYIDAGRVTINGKIAEPGQMVQDGDVVEVEGQLVIPPETLTTIMLNKPRGVVVSRDGQGSDTVYDLLPPEYQRLNPIGRLDKDSSGLLLLTNDGQLAQALSHPSNQKVKIYEVTIDKPLQPLHRQMISDHGLQLADGLSRLQLDRMRDGNDLSWQITMHEGRNRQIRRTFEALGYVVQTLHRTQFGSYKLGSLPTKEHRMIG